MNSRLYRVMHFLMGMVLCGGSIAHGQHALPSGPMAFPSDMPPAQAQQFQEEMAAFQEEFESLSPQEQDEFFKSMDDAVKKIDELAKTSEGKELLNKLEKGTISDEELDGLINQLVEEEVPKKEKIEEKKEKKEPEIPKQVLTSEHEKAINAINLFIAHTNAFLVKTATIPEFTNKIKQWSKKKDITLKNGQTWNALKADIERLVEQLSKLLERDPKTKEYYHIDELLKNETLRNNILKVQKNITKIEPLAEEMPLLGAKKMRKESKKAYQKLLNEYHEALYVLKITDALKKLFELFDPIAKKYREAEEKAVKEAQRLGKPHFAGPGKFISESMPSAGYAPAGPVSALRYQPPSGYIPPSKNDYAYASRGSMRKPAEKKSRAVPKKSEEPKGEKEKAKPVDSIKDSQLKKEIDDSLSKIEDRLKSATQTIQDSNLVKKLNKSLIDSSPLDVSLAVETLPELNKTLNIQKGLLGDLHQLHRKIKRQAPRASVQSKLSKMYDEHTEDITELHDALDKLQQNWDSKKGTIPANKKYAYFGMTDIEVAVPKDATNEQLAAINEQKNLLKQAKSKIFAPYSLFEIKDLLQKVKATIDDFAQEKLTEDKK